MNKLEKEMSAERLIYPLFTYSTLNKFWQTKAMQMSLDQ